ncbi:MAG: hypothetical protein PHT03_06235 [Bacilli bacterium]|nr:hypothetical protein [Bacilli bacterium]MDD4388556.1 hypothetical protein [Bacilli bacterium]
MKDFFITRKEDIYRFYIFPKIAKNKINPKKLKNKNDIEISYELLLDIMKNRK